MCTCARQSLIRLFGSRVDALSSTHAISYGERSFWAYDVALGVVLKHMIDIAESSNSSANAAWLAEQASWWRVVAGLGNGCYGLDINKEWFAEQIDEFISIVRSACHIMSERRTIPAEEIVAWPMLDVLHLYTRGAAEVNTVELVELGEAIVALVNGSLPPAPKGTWWLYGWPGGRSTIEMRVSEWHQPIDGPA